MGGLSKVHMPSSARAGTLATNNPQDRRAAKERKDARLLMLLGLLFCRLCKAIKNGGFFYSKLVLRPVKRCIRQNAIPQRGDPCNTSYTREAQLRSSTRVARGTSD